jgi:SAM-dependent methyltransferase
MNEALQKLIQRHHFAHGRAYDRHAGRVFGGVYRRVAEDVAAAAPTGGVVLDAGCGSGRLAVEIALRRPDLCVRGVDLEHGMIDVARRRAERANLADRVQFTVADLADLPLPDGSVDLIVSTACCCRRVRHGSMTSAGSRPRPCEPPPPTWVAASIGTSCAPGGSRRLSSSASR